MALTLAAPCALAQNEPGRTAPIQIESAVTVPGQAASAPALSIQPLPISAAPAKLPPFRISVEGKLTATDNGALATAGRERNDLVASVRPTVMFERRGANLEMRAEAAVTLLGFANGTQDGGVFPEARGSLKATLIDRLLFVEALAGVQQAERDPFGPRSDDVTTANRRTSSAYRVAPSLQRDLSANTSLLVRHEASLTTNASGEGDRLVSNRSLARVERKPVPVGGSIEISRLKNESSGVAESQFELDTVKLRADLGIDGQLVLGVIGGVERSKLLLSDSTDRIYGLAVRWNPGPRTELLATAEHHFFGLGGELAFRHRMPFLSAALSLSRQPVTSSTSLGVLAQGSDIRSFLDALLTTRYPDPTARAALVSDLVATRGLQTKLPNPIDVVAQYPQLQTIANGTLVFLGTRNTASISLYRQTLRQINPQDGHANIPIDPVADSRQTGAAFQFTRRLTPQLNLDALARWSKIRGLAARSGDVTDQKTFRLALVQVLSPRTSTSAGVQHNRYATTSVGFHSYDATLAFVGMSHRF